MPNKYPHPTDGTTLAKQINTGKTIIGVTGDLEYKSLLDYPFGLSIKTLPGIKWVFVNSMERIRKEEAEDLLPVVSRLFPNGEPLFEMAGDKGFTFSAIDALKSIIEANCTCDNRYKKPDKKNYASNEMKVYKRDLEAWKAYEKKVFKKILVFKERK